ncbi:MAG TPA: FHA domain-containing protein [Pyrinomonadaceae bacterium]|nr:FHA domain-containing protein [Pyrinomonadaceae bacterium]
MRPAIILTFRDDDGVWHELEVGRRRFTIGSGADNDLVIRTPAVSRRHAVIENHGGGVLAYDCQSSRGTLLNNAPLRGSAVLRSGDLLTLGGACDITVKLRTPSDPPARAERPASAPPPPAANNPGGRTPSDPRPRHDDAPALSPLGAQPRTVLAAAAAILLILVAGFVLLARRQPSPAAGVNAPRAHSEAPPVQTGAESPAVAEPGDPARPGDEELERDAVRAVQHASGQNRPYAFPPDALRDIARHIEQYRQSSRLRDAFVSMQRDARSVATAARDAGVEPDLVMYAALAQSDGGRDPSATARAMIPQLAQLRETFGGGDPDGCLIILAAYTDGVGSRRSHPLLATIRRLVRRSPFAERNVWFLRERGGLSDAAYDLVIRTVAVGTIAQDPRRYGVQADPLVY